MMWRHHLGDVEAGCHHSQVTRYHGDPGDSPDHHSEPPGIHGTGEKYHWYYSSNTNSITQAAVRPRVHFTVWNRVYFTKRNKNFIKIVQLSKGLPGKGRIPCGSIEYTTTYSTVIKKTIYFLSWQWLGMSEFEHDTC